MCLLGISWNLKRIYNEWLLLFDFQTVQTHWIYYEGIHWPGSSIHHQLSKCKRWIKLNLTKSTTKNRLKNTAFLSSFDHFLFFRLDSDESHWLRNNNASWIVLLVSQNEIVEEEFPIKLLLIYNRLVSHFYDLWIFRSWVAPGTVTFFRCKMILAWKLLKFHITRC